MARTFIGNLILRLQENVTAGAKKAADALRNLDRAAASMGQNNSGAGRLGQQLDAINEKARQLATAPWGRGLQAQFEKLGASARELDRLRSSWDALQARLNSGNINGALRRVEIKSWATAAVGELTRVRAAMKTTEAQANSMRRAIFEGMKPIYAGAGLGTGSYVAGRLGSMTLTADATVERERFRLQASGFDPGQRAAIEARAQELAVQYGQFTGNVMEMLREASLAIPNLRDAKGNVIKSGFQSAMELSNAITQFGILMGNIHGQQQVAPLTRAMMKSFDVLGITDPAVMMRSMDIFAKMNRIIGKDTDPQQLFLAAKYMRGPGKAFDPEFIYGLLPALMAESSGSDVGTSLRAFFSNTAGERRSKRAQATMKEFGLLDEKGQVAGADLMTNPGLWIESILKPRLQAKGVDTNNSVRVAQILSQIFDNRLSADIAQKFLEQIAQYRDTQDRARNAVGLEGAKDVRQGDPFAGWRAFLDSLQNLAASTGITSIINPALNSLADNINQLGVAVGKLSPEALSSLGTAAVALGALGAIKIGTSLAALVSAGPALMGSAAALTAAAGRLGGAPGAPGAPGGGGKGGWLSWIGALARGGLWGVVADQAVGAATGQTISERVIEAVRSRLTDGKLPSAGPYIDPATMERARRDQQEAMRDPEGYRGRAFSKVHPTEMTGAATPQVNVAPLDAAMQKATETKTAVDALNTTVTPTVETGSLAAAVQMANQLEAALQRIGGASAQIGDSISRQLRASQSDFGVVP